MFSLTCEVDIFLGNSRFAWLTDCDAKCMDCFSLDFDSEVTLASKMMSLHIHLASLSKSIGYTFDR